MPYQKSTPREVRVVHELEDRLIRRGLRLGGTVSGEHGVGVGKRDFIVLEHGSEHVAMQRAVRKNWWGFPFGPVHRESIPVLGEMTAPLPIAHVMTDSFSDATKLWTRLR